VSIAPQPATPTSAPRARRQHQAPLQLAPEPRPGRALAKISGLLALTAFGVAVSAAIAVVAVLMLAAGVG
jgi:hypothetical protein